MQGLQAPAAFPGYLPSPSLALLPSDRLGFNHRLSPFPSGCLGTFSNSATNHVSLLSPLEKRASPIFSHWGMTSYLMWDQGGHQGPGEVLKKYSLPSLPSHQIQVLGSQLKISESSLSSPVGFEKPQANADNTNSKWPEEILRAKIPHLCTRPLPATAMACRCCVPARVLTARVFLFHTLLTLLAPPPAMGLSLLMPFKS